MATIQEELAAIDAILNSGVVQTSMDGQTTTFDHGALERRKRELLNQSLTALVNNQVRPAMMRMTFSRFG